MLQLQIQTNETDVQGIKHLIQSAIDAEIQNLKISIQKTERILKEFEIKYGLSTEDFFKAGAAEDLEDGDEEYITWLGEYRLKEKLTESLHNLESIDQILCHNLLFQPYTISKSCLPRKR